MYWAKIKYFQNVFKFLCRFVSFCKNHIHKKASNIWLFQTCPIASLSYLSEKIPPLIFSASFFGAAEPMERDGRTHHPLLQITVSFEGNDCSGALHPCGRGGFSVELARGVLHVMAPLLRLVGRFYARTICLSSKQLRWRAIRLRLSDRLWAARCKIYCRLHVSKLAHLGVFLGLCVGHACWEIFTHPRA